MQRLSDAELLRRMAHPTGPAEPEALFDLYEARGDIAFLRGELDALLGLLEHLIGQGAAFGVLRRPLAHRRGE
jgi:hypothetical protein